MVSSSAGRWAYSAASARRSCAGNTAKADGDAMCCLTTARITRGSHRDGGATPRVALVGSSPSPSVAYAE